MKKSEENMKKCEEIIKKLSGGNMKAIWKTCARNME